MRRQTYDKIEPCLAHLRRLPFVVDVRLQPAPFDEADGLLALETPTGTQEYLVEEKRTHLTREIVDHLATRIRTGKPGRPPWILFAPYVGAGMAERLGRYEIQYVDRAGNCRVQVGNRYLALVEGRRPPEGNRAKKGIGTRPEGYKFLFDLLARPDLVGDPVRKIAEHAGVGKTTVADLLRRLHDEGIIFDVRGRRQLLDRQELLNRWITGYATVLRPRLLLGRYRTRDVDPKTLEERVEATLGDEMAWAWGGAAAAMRLVGHYRGRDTVLHVGDQVFEKDLPRRLGALPADDGELIILRVPTPTAFDGAAPRTVHPLLVYAELLAMGKDRAREEAQLIYERHLIT